MNHKKRPRSHYNLNRNIPPTASTFVNKGTCRPGVCNLRGYRENKYFM